jgi:hypothetical protein
VHSDKVGAQIAGTDAEEVMMLVETGGVDTWIDGLAPCEGYKVPGQLRADQSGGRGRGRKEAPERGNEL